jgi:soluble lytic murein transglycosylase-like protein
VIDLSTIEARKQLVAKYAIPLGVPVDLACAVAHHESGWSMWAMRYEPAFYSHYIQPLVNTNQVRTATEATARATSYGLFQCMGQTAREAGFAGKYLTQLCDPDVGVEYGIKKLKQCLDKNSGDERAALLSYNGGSDPQYPDLVLQWLNTYQ